MTQEKLAQVLAKHKAWLNGKRNGKRANLQGENLRGADLQGADLQGADLQGADLRDANLDYSVFPLWCGSFGIRCDRRLAAQLAYHFCRLVTEDAEVKRAQKSLKALANTFHRVNECGWIK